MITELKVGDYIEKSELDTEHKYNDVVEVFGHLSSEFAGSKLTYIEHTEKHKCTHFFIGDDFCLDSVSFDVGFTSYCTGRKLTYDQVMSLKKADPAKQKSNYDSVSTQYLKRCIDVQAERGEQYDQGGTGERSFSAAADAFNALTGEKLSGSDVCLLLTCLKVVRQNSNKSRVHDDSVLDGVSYLSLWAEELTKEIS